MTFVIRIVGDTKSTEIGVERLVGRLEQAEQAGEQAGAAVARGAQQGAAGMDKAAAATDRARDAMGRFAAGARMGSSVLEQVAAATDRGAMGVTRFAGAAMRWQSSLDAVAGAAERAIDGVNRIGAPASHGQLVTSLGRVGMAFDGLTQAIAREQAMLDRINGPTRRYEQDLQTLDGLLAKNRISTAQYAEQVARLNRELERSQTLGPAGPATRPAAAAAPGMLARAGGALERAGAVLSPAQAIAGGVAALGAREVLQAASAYQTLQNRMRVIVGTGESVGVAFERIRSSATATRSSIGTTIEAYQRLRGATREMGLSSDSLLRVTERINKAITVQGAGAQESAAGMQQLAQALASGRLQGDEFRSIGENLPYVRDIIAQSLGVSISKLREMASQGRLTSEVVINAFEKMGSKIDQDFAKTVPTLAQQWDMLKDQTTIAIGKTLEASGAFGVLGNAASVLGSSVGLIGDVFGGLGQALGSVFGLAGPVGDALGGMITPVTLLSAAMLGLTSPFTLIVAALPLIKAGFDALGGLSDWLNQFGAWNDESLRAAKSYLAEYEAMKKLIAEEEKLVKASEALAAARRAGVEVQGFNLDTAKAQADLSRMGQLLLGVNVAPAFDEATKKGLELSAAIEKIKQQRALDEQAEQAKRAARELLGVNETLIAQAKYWRGVSDRIAEYQGVIGKVYDATKQNMELGLAGTDALDVALMRYGITQQDLLDTQLGLRNATIEQTNAGNRYGKTLTEIQLRELEHKDALKAVNELRKQGALTTRQWAEEMKRLGVEEDRATKLLKELRQPALDWSATIAALNALLRTGRIDLQQYNDELQRLAASQPTRTGELPRGANFVGGRRVGGEEFAIGFEALSAEQQARATERGRTPSLASMGIGTTIDTGWMDDLTAKARQAGGALEDSALKTARWKQELELLQLQGQNDGLARGLERIRVEVTDTAGALEGALVNAFHGAEQALIDFVTTGEFSFKKMVDSMLADLTRLLIRQAATGILGAFGGGGPASVFGTGATQAFAGLFGSAPGFAHGGSMRVDGRPGIDTNLVMLRASNGETVTVTPPGQAPPAQGGAPAAVTVVNVYSDAEMDRYMEQKGEQHFVNFLRRNEPAIRGRTTGR